MITMQFILSFQSIFEEVFIFRYFYNLRFLESKNKNETGKVTNGYSFILHELELQAIYGMGE